MTTLFIDIETFSGSDLGKTGVYRYSESPDFEVLLFGYSIDGGEVRVVDLASGEALPSDVRDALTDESVMKWTHNASFERVCLSRWLGLPTGEYMDSRSWRCTMVWSAYLGLPLSLESAAKLLRAEKQKLSEGKDLIRYFSCPCKPTAANAGRTRNLPAHAPDKWQRYKAYNLRDVETEIAIMKRLSRFPVPDDEWENYILDQEINDRGIRLDMDLVSEAIRCDKRSRMELMRVMRELTDLENPNSVSQIRGWLAENGLDTGTLDKAAVTQLLKTAPEELGEVLTLRQDLAKSSVRKYTAMAQAVCSDSRARGLLQFYGANRTGRWCLTGDHEVLTDNGWERLDEWQGGKIACWNPIGETVSFQKSTSLCFPYKGDVYEFSDKRIAQISTPDHTMYVKRRYGGEWTSDTVENMTSYRPSIPFTGYRRTSPSLEHNELRVLVMVQADAHFTAEGNIRFAFTKERKVARCKELLRRAGILFAVSTYPQDSKIRYTITINARSVPLWLRMFKEKTFGTWLLDESADVFFDELVYWDGYRSAINSIQYTTCNKQNADIVQAFAHVSGRSALIKTKVRSAEHPKWKDAYSVDIWLTPKNCHEVRCNAIKRDFDGTVHCAETPTGFFLVRRNGRVWVTGNSGRILQPQNLPQNHLPDLTQARQLVKSGAFDMLEVLYDSVPAVLSELIRTAFVPEPGRKFIVADFSAIEARVIAWLAGETWRNEVFATHGKIYEASASQMFRVPIGGITKGSLLRQKGKIAELALGYGGSVGALKAMGALEMGLKQEELKPLVNAWRAANPNIVKLWYAVENAAVTSVKHNTFTELNGIRFSWEKGILFVRLPSGRRLAYVKPKIEMNRFGRDALTYEGVGKMKKWERIETFGGKLTENIIQAVARDLLAESMRRLHQAGYRIVMHCHDEAVIETENAELLDDVIRMMCQTPGWAKGLNLNADGYACEYYRKD